MAIARYVAWLFIVTMTGLVLTALEATAADPVVRVRVFPGPQNLALFAAQDLGLFAKYKIAVQIEFTSNSQGLRNGLVQGAFEIAQAGVDNAVSLVDVDKKDVVIVAGGSNGMNELIVRPEIADVQDLRGKKVVVDAPETAYALLAYKMLAIKGVERSAYGVVSAGGCQQRLAAMRSEPANAAAMLNLPCNVQAKADGYKSLGNAVATLGPYQADGIWVMRTWADANRDVLIRYLKAIIEGYRWAADPANKSAAAALVGKALKLEQKIATDALDIAIGANAGLAQDAAFDMEGFQNTLRLRAEMIGSSAAASPDKYFDLSFYNAARTGL